MQSYRDFLMLRARLRGGGPGRKLPGSSASNYRPSADSGGLGAPARGAVLDVHGAAAQQSFQALSQLAGGAHRPLRTESERAARRGTGIFDPDGARPGPEGSEEIGQAPLQGPRIAPALRPHEDDVARLLLTHRAQIADPPCRMRQPSLKSSKRSIPSTSTNASFGTMSRYFW